MSNAMERASRRYAVKSHRRKRNRLSLWNTTLSSLLLWLLLYGHPLISALLLAYVSREARALIPTETTHSKLSFVVVGGMALMLLGGLLLNLFAMLGSGPPPQLLLFLPAMCGAVLIAMYSLFGLFRQRKNTRAHPKDASPFDVDSEHLP